MTFQQLLYVSEVAQLGSINKAARLLYISQSTVSNAIKDLEQELQLQIFQRSTTGISLTPEGKEFLNYARSLLNQKEHVEKVFKKSDIKHFSRVTVASQHFAFTIQAMIALMNASEEKNYEICVKELTVTEILEDVYDEKSDFGVVMVSGVMRHFMEDLVDSRDLQFHEICRIRPRICVRKGHPLAQAPYVTQEDITQYPYATMYQDYTTPFDIAESFRLFSRNNPTQVAYVTDRAALYDVLLNTNSYIFSSGMRTPYERENTQMINFRGDMEEMRFGWIKLRRKVLTEEGQHFIAHLSKICIDHALAMDSEGKSSSEQG